MRITLAILTLLFAVPAFAAPAFFAPAWAQSSNDIETLTKKEQAARQKAEALEAERAKVRKDVDALKKTLAKAARQTQSIETDLTTFERDIENLTQRSANLTAQIQEDRIQYTKLIAALQRLEAKPPPTLSLTPSGAKQAATAGQLITTLSDQLKTRAEALALNLTALEITQAQLKLKKNDLSQTQARLTAEMKSVNQGLATKSELETKLAGERKLAAAEADRFAAESKTLLELIAKLESQAAKVVPNPKPGRKPSEKLILPEGTKRFAEAKGTMLRPISGRLLKSYGRGEKGMTFAGRAGGQVLAPYAGRVEFSGPFKNYDNVVILNVGDGYFVLLTGLDDLFVDAGDTVRRGEPVGDMPAQSNSELYIELRRNGSPVDPKPWLAPSDVKSG